MTALDRLADVEQLVTLDRGAVEGDRWIRNLGRHGEVPSSGQCAAGRCSEPTAARFVMQSTLLGGTDLPPPPTGTWVFVSSSGSGTGSTTDRGIPTVVELVIGDVPRPYVAPNLFGAPVGQRIHLVQPVYPCPRGHGGRRTLRRVLATKPGEPGVCAVQRPGQRFDLSNLTALETVLHTLAEREHALFGNESLDEVVARKDHLDFDAVSTPHFVDQVVGLLGQPTGIEGEQTDLGSHPRHQIHQNCTLACKTACEPGRGQAVGHPADHPLGRPIFEVRQLGGIGGRWGWSSRGFHRHE